MQGLQIFGRAAWRGSGKLEGCWRGSLPGALWLSLGLRIAPLARALVPAHLDEALQGDVILD